MTADLHQRSRGRLAVIVGAVLVVGLAVAAYLLLREDELRPELAAVHDATAQYETLAAAEAAGYGELLDLDGIACIDHHDQGAMGVHYVQGELVGDATVDPLRPEAIIYEPQPSGAMTIVGVEYVVFQEMWDAENDAPPVLFGQEFTPVGADNRYGIPPHYQLHAWVWRSNPAGTFADYNPDVTCEHASADHAAGDVSGRTPREVAPTPAATRPPRLSGV